MHHSSLQIAVVLKKLGATTIHNCSSKLCLLFGLFGPRSVQQRQLCRNHNFGTAKLYAMPCFLILKRQFADEIYAGRKVFEARPSFCKFVQKAKEGEEVYFHTYSRLKLRCTVKRILRFDTVTSMINELGSDNLIPGTTVEECKEAYERLYRDSSNSVSNDTPMTVLELDNSTCEWVQFNVKDSPGPSKKRKAESI